jgi:hypothetical protein
MEEIKKGYHNSMTMKRSRRQVKDGGDASKERLQTSLSRRSLIQKNQGADNKSKFSQKIWSLLRYISQETPKILSLARQVSAYKKCTSTLPYKESARVNIDNEALIKLPIMVKQCPSYMLQLTGIITF